MFLSNRPFVALAPVIFALSAPLNAANAQTAVSVDVTPDQLRIMAANSIVNGNPTQGYEMAQALLARDPNDVEALIIRARAARDLGKLTEALSTARKAWFGAQNASERFGGLYGHGANALDKWGENTCATLAAPCRAQRAQ